MKKQGELGFEHEGLVERTSSWNEAQRQDIRAALKALFDAALCLSEEPRNEKRKS